MPLPSKFYHVMELWILSVCERCKYVETTNLLTLVNVKFQSPIKGQLTAFPSTSSFKDLWWRSRVFFRKIFFYLWFSPLDIIITKWKGKLTKTIHKDKNKMINFSKMNLQLELRIYIEQWNSKKKYECWETTTPLHI